MKMHMQSNFWPYFLPLYGVAAVLAPRGLGEVGQTQQCKQ